MEKRGKSKNILVTGGAGFIGSWAIKHLVQKHSDYNIVCFDKLEYCASLRNLEPIFGSPNFTFIQGDITEPANVRSALEKHSIDTIIHFAAQSHVDLSFGNSFDFTRVNVLGTHVLLEAAKAAKISRFLHFSTDEVYGDVASDAEDLSEQSILAPTNPYSASKAAAEMMVHAYYKSFKLPVIIVRANNVYGPFQYVEKRLIVHGDGTPTRRYLCGSDAADAVDLVLSKGEIGQVYNIASDNEISNIDLCRLLLREYGLACNTDAELRQHVHFVQDRPYNDQRYAANGDKLRSLGFKQSVTFEVGLKQTIAWYKENGESWWGDISASLSPFPVKIVNDDSGEATLRPNTPFLTPSASRQQSFERLRTLPTENRSGQ